MTCVLVPNMIVWILMRRVLQYELVSYIVANITYGRLASINTRIAKTESLHALLDTDLGGKVDVLEAETIVHWPFSPGL
jgi:hypothetical protein